MRPIIQTDSQSGETHTIYQVSGQGFVRPSTGLNVSLKSLDYVCGATCGAMSDRNEILVGAMKLDNDLFHIALTSTGILFVRNTSTLYRRRATSMEILTYFSAYASQTQNFSVEGRIEATYAITELARGALRRVTTDRRNTSDG